MRTTRRTHSAYMATPWPAVIFNLYIAALTVVGVMAGIGGRVKGETESFGGDHFADRADQVAIGRELAARIKLLEPDHRPVDICDRFRQFDPLSHFIAGSFGTLIYI